MKNKTTRREKSRRKFHEKREWKLCVSADAVAEHTRRAMLIPRGVIVQIYSDRSLFYVFVCSLLSCRCVCMWERENFSHLDISINHYYVNNGPNNSLIAHKWDKRMDFFLLFFRWFFGSANHLRANILKSSTEEWYWKKEMKEQTVLFLSMLLKIISI